MSSTHKTNKHKTQTKQKNTSTLGHLLSSAHTLTFLVPFLFLRKGFFLLCSLHGPGSLYTEDLLIFGFIRQESLGVLQNEFIKWSFNSPQFQKLKKDVKKAKSSVKNHVLTLKSSGWFVLLQLNAQKKKKTRSS